MAQTIAFPNMFSSDSNTVQLLTGKEAIKTAMRSALLSRQNELLGDPSFGSQILSYVFDVKNATFGLDVREEIARTLNQNVSGISCSSNDIYISDDPQSTGLRIVIYYNYNNTNEKDAVTAVVSSLGNITIT